MNEVINKLKLLYGDASLDDKGYLVLGTVPEVSALRTILKQVDYRWVNKGGSDRITRQIDAKICVRFREVIEQEVFDMTDADGVLYAKATEEDKFSNQECVLDGFSQYEVTTTPDFGMLIKLGLRGKLELVHDITLFTLRGQTEASHVRLSDRFHDKRVVQKVIVKGNVKLSRPQRANIPNINQIEINGESARTSYNFMKLMYEAGKKIILKSTDAAAKEVYSALRSFPNDNEGEVCFLDGLDGDSDVFKEIRESGGRVVRYSTGQWIVEGNYTITDGYSLLTFLKNCKRAREGCIKIQAITQEKLTIPQDCIDVFLRDFSFVEVNTLCIEKTEHACDESNLALIRDKVKDNHVELHMKNIQGLEYAGGFRKILERLMNS